VRREIGPLAVVERSPQVARLLARHLSGIRVAHVATLDELAALAEAAAPEAVVVNDPLGEAGSAGPWPASLRHVPVLHCRAAGPLAPLEDERSSAAGAEEGRLVVSLLKPVMRERLYALLAEMAQRAAGEAAGAAALPARPFRMLVVEDDEDALRLFGRLLRLAPAEVRGPFSAFVPLELQRGEDAIAFLRSADGQAIDGALLDIRLGSSTGFDVLREIERHEALRRVPVCLTTGGDLTEQPLITPFVTLSKSEGLTASELLHATAALMQVVLPGVSVNVTSAST
jgi:CheY-like chemotaxis protein